MKNTYMMGSDDYQSLDEMTEESGVPMGIGENCNINNAILDKNCCVGNNVKMNGGAHLDDTDNDLYLVRDGIIVVRKGAVIPDGFEI